MRRRAVALAGVLFTAPLIATTAVAPAGAATPQTVAVGDYGVWTVPAGVTSITIELTGGDGGTATSSAGVSVQAVGGRGELVSGTIAVEPGDELVFRVGTAGTGVDVASIADSTTNPGGTGDGGESAPDVVDGATVLLAGSAAGGNPTSPTTDGRDANIGTSSAGGSRSSANAPGGGGAGWPGGDSQSVLIADGPIAFAASGGGGGLPFIGEALIDPVTGVKGESSGRDGSATITYTPGAVEVDDELAATGASGLAGGAALAVLLLAAGAVVVANGRRATR